MKKRIRLKPIILLITLISIGPVCVIGQTKSTVYYPKVGDVLEDYQFNDVVNHKSKTANLSDFRGKWLLIDFWGYSCHACLDSYPKMDSISRKFKENISILMVGATGNPSRNKMDVEKIVKRIYRRLDSTYQFTVATAFDSVLFKKYDIGSLPHIMVIDPNGRLVAKTVAVDEKKLVQLIRGQSPNFVKHYSRHEFLDIGKRAQEIERINEITPTLTSEYSNREIYQSKLSVSLPGTIGNVVDLYHLKKRKSNRKEIKVNARNQTLEYLYKIAFFGKNGWGSTDTLSNRNEKPNNIFSKAIDLKIANPEEFLDENKRYDYSLMMPADNSTPDVLMKVIREDLQRIFPYSAHREWRNVPALFIEISDENKIKSMRSTDSGPTEYPKTEDINGFSLKRVPVKEFIAMITDMMWLKLPVIDATNSEEIIDIDFKADMLNNESILNNLENYGFKIKKGIKKMKVLVIE